MKNEITITTDEICELTNLTRPRLLQLADEERIPKPVRGQWQLVATLRGLLTYYQDRLKSRATTPELIQAKVAKAQHDERLAGLKLAEKEKTVLQKDDVEKTWARHIVSARLILQRVLPPAELKRVLAELEIKASEYEN